MSISDPASLPVVAEPSATPANITSLIRLAGGVIAGLLAKAGFDQANSSSIGYYAGALVVTLAIALWNLYKNRRVANTLAAAMVSAPVRLVPAAALPPTPLASLGVAFFVVMAVVSAGRVLTACSTAPLVPPSAQVVALQGDTSLDLAYNVAAQTYIAVLPSLSPALKGKLKPELIRAYALVKAVDSGEVIAGQASLVEEIGAASSLINSIRGDLALVASPAK